MCSVCIYTCMLLGIRVSAAASLHTGTAVGWRGTWRWTHQLAVKTVDALTSGIHCHLTGAQNISAEGLHGIQPLNLYQAGQEVGDAVTCCAHSLEELQAITHTTDLVTLQAKALGQVPPCLHYSCLTAV